MTEEKDEGQHATMTIAESMIQHTGTKNVKRSNVPMTRAMYCKYRGWDIPANENPNDLVYVVEYDAVEGKKSNHPDHLGYVSMSPKDVFDEAYDVSETFMDRLMIEEKQLHERMIALGKVIGEGLVPESEEEILNLQLSAMTTYAYVLKVRISNQKKSVISKTQK